METEAPISKTGARRAVAGHFGSGHAAWVLSLVLSLALPAAAQAEDYIATATNGTVTITGYTGPSAEVTIPGRIRGLPVSSIGDYAFSGRSTLTSISIPDTVASIGVYAFQGCTGLTNVTMGRNVTNIGVWAFASCSGLTSVTIPDSVTRIGADAFRSCTGLTNIVIGRSVTNIGSRFSGCRSLGTITVDALNAVYSSVDGVWFNKSQTALIECPEGRAGSYKVPDTVTSIEGNAFADCRSLTNITISDGVTNIARDAFPGCASLASVTIGSGITNIDYGAFRNCALLAHVKIGSNVTSIGSCAFADCTSLTNLAIPDSVTNIDVLAFSWCTSLSSIRIPDQVINIGDDAFRGCARLTEVAIGRSVTNIGSRFPGCSRLATVLVDPLNTVYSTLDGVLFSKDRTTLIRCPEGKTGTCTIPKSVTSLGPNAFADCTGLTNITIPDGVLTIGHRAFCYCTRLASLTIPNSATCVGEDAARGCSRLADVTVGSSVTNIGSRFAGCHSLTTITVNAPNTVYSSVDGVLFNRNRTALIQCPEGKAGSYTVPDGVTSIGDNAFADCTSLTNVTIAGSVTNIGVRAFCYCQSLAGIVIPNNVIGIGNDAFRNCASLTNAVIGSSVSNIRSRFPGCRKLMTIGVDSLNTFYSSVEGVLFDKHQTMLIQCPEGRAGSYSVPVGVTSIGSNAFSDCASLNNITIADSVTNIGMRAFAWCTGLATITIPDRVTRIGSMAFESCTSLTGVYSKGNAPGVDPDAFSNDDKATVYYLPGTMGWGPKFGRRPTAVWVARAPSHAQASPGSASVRGNPANARTGLPREMRNR
ncbi:MAG TPA: leucine-rich repeat domain-containing protein [Verrucomicrobiae bacterium]